VVANRIGRRAILVMLLIAAFVALLLASNA